MTSFTEKYWGGGGGPELAVFDKVSYNRTPDKSVYWKKYFSYFSTKLYVVGTQKNRLNEHPKHMFKLMGKEISAILGAQTIIIWAYVIII